MVCLLAFYTFANESFLRVVFFAAGNVLARVVMKNVANCDARCELRDSVNQQAAERMRCLGVILRTSGTGVLSILYLSRYTPTSGAAVCQWAFVSSPWHMNIVVSYLYTICGMECASSKQLVC